jgi:hypothetical protein
MVAPALRTAVRRIPLFVATIRTVPSGSNGFTISSLNASVGADGYARLSGDWSVVKGSRLRSDHCSKSMELRLAGDAEL